MPFTPAHAAAALPLLRFRLVPSALVVGTMAPDFEYFLRFAPGGGFGHTIPGAFLQSLPLALIVLWIFHAIVKAPLVQLLPDGVRSRIAARARFRFGGPVGFLLIAASALVGIATHLAWDSFTHFDTWPYRHVEWLRQATNLPVLGLTAHFAILQLVSSVGGMLILCAWAAHWYRVTAPIRSDDEGEALPVRRRYMVLAGIVAAAALAAIIRAAIVLTDPDYQWVMVLGDGVATGIAVAWWMLVLYAIFPARRRARVQI
jgi:uncharacterized protein DUF4184